jgi:hypothetical protein
MVGWALRRVAGHPLLRRLVSPAGLLLVALCFTLPFVAVSCDTPVQVRADYAGTDMLAGGRPSVTVSDETVSPQDAEELSDEPIDLQPAAVLAMLAIVAGILVAALATRRARVLGGTVAAAATVLFLGLNQILVQRQLALQIEGELGAQLPGGTSGGDYVETRYGFWLALSFASAVVLYNGFELYRITRLRGPTGG